METNTLLRVTQMDAIHLDNEIYKLSYNLIQDCCKFLPPGSIAPYEPEINALIKLLILNYSIKQGSSTFGQKLLAVKYANLTPTKTALYVFLSSLDYVKRRLELWRPSHGFNAVVSKAEVGLKIFYLVNLALFLRGGTKPLVIDRLLGLDQVFVRGNVQRQFTSKYLARELLWNGLIEVLVFILPLINYHKLRRTIARNIPFKRSSSDRLTSESRIIMTESTLCVHCGEPPILPHHMDCSHVFCYTCLKGNQAADSKYECPSCGHFSANTVCRKVCAM